MAQISYAFYFTLTLATDHSRTQKIVVFFAVLPFGQLIPFFIWLNSFHFECLDSLLDIFSFSYSQARYVNIEDDTDKLWKYIEQKYKSHGGFLIEALVEAIPQC